MGNDCTIDKLGKIVYGDKKLLYNCKGTEVPCLQMVHYILTVTNCDPTDVEMNSTVNTFIESKKLKLFFLSLLSINFAVS